MYCFNVTPSYNGIIFFESVGLLYSRSLIYESFIYTAPYSQKFSNMAHGTLQHQASHQMDDIVTQLLCSFITVFLLGCS